MLKLARMTFKYSIHFFTFASHELNGVMHGKIITFILKCRSFFPPSCTRYASLHRGLLIWSLNKVSSVSSDPLIRYISIRQCYSKMCLKVYNLSLNLTRIACKDYLRSADYPPLYCIGSIYFICLGLLGEEASCL